MDPATINATTPIVSYSFHRGDPLDIPLIDHHLLTQILLPRLVSAIRYKFPEVHFDGTTGSGPNGHHGGTWIGRNYNALLWKRILERIFRTCLVLGSCRRYSARRRRLDYIGGKNNHEVHVATPAMQSCGISIRTTDSGDGGVSVIQQYGKVMALIFATVIVPGCYEELRIRRKMQLDERDQRMRLEEVRRELRSSMLHVTSVTPIPYIDHDIAGDNNDTTRQQETTSIERQRHQQRVQLLLNQRSNERKSLVSSLIIDAILGMGEILYPPLQLFNYLMYLWGMCSTPDLGMRVAGWEYSRDPSSSALFSPRDGSNNNNNIISYDDYGEAVEHQQSHGGSFHQRHANFQYGNRRLLVEEALRAASLILPPRTHNAGSAGGAVGNAVAAVDTPHRANRGINERPEEEWRRSITRGSVEEYGEEHNRSRGVRSGAVALITGVNRIGLMRKRILSFIGVVEHDESDYDATTASSNERRSSLKCSLCHAVNPAIPYIASCGHCYCYVCLRVAVMDNLSFRCVDCGRIISSSSRLKQSLTELGPLRVKYNR